MKFESTIKRSGLAALLVLGGVLLSAASCATPEPVPGQPLTAAQQNQLDREKAMEEHEARSQDERPCLPGSC